jgi:hypothetical protein
MTARKSTLAIETLVNAGQSFRPDARRADVGPESPARTARRGLWFAAVFALTALGVIGCGKKADYGSVTGRVTFKGQPVTDGMVLFSSVDPPDLHVNQTARIHSDGTYSAKMSDGPGLVAGKYEVAVKPPVVEGPNSKSAGPRTPRKYDDIPLRYRSLKSSGLSLTVEEGKNPPYDIDMQP